MASHAIGNEKDRAIDAGYVRIFVGSSNSPWITSSTVFDTQSITPGCNMQLICPSERKKLNEGIRHNTILHIGSKLITFSQSDFLKPVSSMSLWYHDSSSLIRGCNALQPRIPLQDVLSDHFDNLDSAF
jgi:hypothetical protein